MEGTNTPGEGQNKGLSWSGSAAQSQNKTQTPPISSNSKPKSTPSFESPKSGRGALAASLIVGIIIGVLIGWAWFALRAPATTPENSGEATTTTQTQTDTDTVPSVVSENSDTLSVPTPQTSGLEVAVSKVSVEQPTWVVIYESHNGIPGNVLGAGLFFPSSQGGKTSGTVELLRGTMPGQTYLVGEAQDDGDHKFSKDTDKPVRDQSGNPVWVQFTTN